MVRKIRVISTRGESKNIETNVTTLGELKPLLTGINIDYDGLKMVVGETRNELTADVAILPEGDFKLFLMPNKTKSGATARVVQLMETMAELLEELVEAVDNGECSVSNKSEYPVKTYQEDVDAAALAEMNRLMSGDY